MLKGLNINNLNTIFFRQLKKQKSEPNWTTCFFLSKKIARQFHQGIKW